MKRRNFLQTLGALAPGSLATAVPESTGAAQVPSVQGRGLEEPRVLIYDDGRHAAGMDQLEPPLTPSDVTITVDQLVNSGVDTLIYYVSYEGGAVLYDSRVAQKAGENVPEWEHFVHYRTALQVRQLSTEGYDRLKLLCDRCHETGIWFIASNYVTSAIVSPRSHGRTSDFLFDNPQFQVGEDRDSRAKHVAPTRLSFLHEEVRKQRFLIFEELLSRYETDGIELNLTDLVPFCRFSEVAQLAPVMTQWIRSLRAVARKAEQVQGRRKRIYARIPAEPDCWTILGYDVPGWVSERLVDGLICVTSDDEGQLDQDLNLTGAVKLALRTPCRVFAGCWSGLGRQLERSATPPMFWAAAANAYEQGAQGFALGEQLWSPNGWPWTPQEYQTIRLLGHPELLATADKHYRIRSQPMGRTSSGGLPGAAPLLPHTLTQGQSLEMPFRVADTLARWQVLGRIKAVRLRLRFSNFRPAGDEVQVEINGRMLPDSILQKIDINCRILKTGFASPYGYIFEYHLIPEYYPAPGQNQVKVTLLKRDPRLKLPFGVYDVDCSIQYRMHRHFERSPVSY